MTDLSRALRRGWSAAFLSALCWVSVLTVPGGLWAQPRAQGTAADANQQALALAQRLGREWSAEGLETILTTHNIDLLNAYERAFRDTALQASRENKKPTALPSAIEALIVKHYHDAHVGGALRALCASNGTRYQTRTLFDLMYAEWRAGKVRPSTYPMRASIFQTDLAGIEAPLLEWLQALNPPDSEDGRSIVRFLGDRRYPPAVPVLAALQRNARPNADTAVTISLALVKIGSGDAIATVLNRLAWLRDQPPGPEVTRETDLLLSEMVRMREDIVLDYADLRRALPAGLSENARANVIALIARLKDEKGVPDLLVFLAEDKLYTRAFQALTAFDSPEVWKQTRAEIERLKHDGKIADGQHRQAAALLDRRIASPEEHFAAKAKAERHKELDAKRGALYATKNALPALKDSPEQYVAGYLAYLNSEERLAEEYADLPTVVGLRGDIGRDYFNLANLVRFRLKQPVKAIGLYGMAQKVGKPMALMAALAVADTYQFDVHDPAKALEVFRRLEADQRLDVSLGLLEPERRAASSWEGAYSHWLKNWLAHQVNYLKTGKPFGGTITEDDINGAALIIFLGGGMAMQDEGVASLYNSTAEALHAGAGTQIDRRAIGRTLDTLPPSSLTLQGTVMLLTLLPDVSAILRYLDKHDPAGYFGACLFAMVESIDRRAVTGREAMLLPGLALDPPGPANPLRAASARFLKERKVTLKIRPDPRGPTP